MHQISSLIVVAERIGVEPSIPGLVSRPASISRNAAYRTDFNMEVLAHKKHTAKKKLH
jgi:hypothetical protein